MRHSGSGAGTQGATDYLTGQIEAPVVKTYTLDPSPIENRTLQTFVVYTASGTATATIKINGVSVTGLTNLAVTSTPQEAIATALNSVSVGQAITLVVTATNGPADLVFRLKYVRT